MRNPLLIAALLSVTSAHVVRAQTPVLRPDTRVEGELVPADPRMSEMGYFKLYRFVGSEGQRLRFVVEGDGMIPVVMIAREVGGLTDYIDGSGGTSEKAVVRFSPPEDGTYLLAVFAHEEHAVGSFSVATEDVTNQRAAAPRVVQQDETLTDSLSENSTYDDEECWTFNEYAFQARAGDRLIITMRSEDLDSYLEVGVVDGAEFQAIAYNDDAFSNLDAQVEFTAPHDGTYVIRAADLNDEFGEFTLQIARNGSVSVPERVQRRHTMRAVLRTQ